MKKIFLLVIFFEICKISNAQNAKDFFFKNENLKTYVANKSISAPINFSNFKSDEASPFIALSVKILNLTAAQMQSAQLQIQFNDKPEIETKNLKAEHESDDNSDFISELIFVRNDIKSISIELETTSTINFDVHPIQLHVYYPQKTLMANNENINFRGSNECGLPKAVSRSVWGAAYGLTDQKQFLNQPAYTNVTHLIVHHSSTENTSSDWNAVVASFFDYHVNVNGWSDIGYNYVIAPNGTLYVGRGGGDNVIGAHYCGKNAHTMGVCLIGDYTNVSPTDTAMQTLYKVLAWKAKKENINPNGAALLAGTIINNVDGHRSGCATDCPGDQIWANLNVIRTHLVKDVQSCALTSTANASDAPLKIYPTLIENNVLNGFGNFQKNTHWQITDVNGRIYKSGIFASDSDVFQTEIYFLSQGVYFFSVRNERTVASKRFLKLN